MAVFKSFLLSIIASTSLVSGEENGWFPVGKKPPVEEESLERDPAIWVLFSKTIDLEKILVRFPEDPTYLVTETGNLCIQSERNGEIFELTVSKKGSLAKDFEDELFESEGMWVHQHVIQTEQHEYRFKTVAHQPESPNHKDFIASFTLQ